MITEKTVDTAMIVGRDGKKLAVGKNGCGSDNDLIVPYPKDVEPTPEGLGCAIAEMTHLEMIQDSIESTEKGTPMSFMPSAAKTTPFELAQAADKRRINIFLDEMERVNTEKAFLSLTGLLVTVGILTLLPSQ